MTNIKNLTICFALLFPYFIYGFISIYNGRIGGDEGIYMLSAVNVLSGKLPYRDFVLNQMPFFPYFYGVAMSIVGKGLINARWVSFFLGLMAIVFVMLTCQKKGGIWAAAIAGSLLTLNKSFIFDMCSVRTQALTVFLTAASLFLIVDSEGQDKKILLSIFMMSLASLVRLSFLPVLVILWGFILFTRWQKRKYWLILAVNTFLLLGIFVFFNQGGNLLYCIYFFHNYANMPWAFERFAYFVTGYLKNQFSILFCFIITLFLFIHKLKDRGAKSFVNSYDIFYLFFLLACYIVTTLIHAIRTISYPTYQTSNIIFIVIFTGLIMGRWASSFANSYKRILFMLFYLVIAFLNMPYQEYVISWNGDGGPVRMHQAVKLIKGITKAGDNVITCNHELAVEANLAVLPGYEIAEFSYSPGMSRAQAKKLNMVYPGKLREDIEARKADIICLTPRDIVMLGQGSAKELEAIFLNNYDVRYVIPQYGQFFQDLYVMKPKSKTT